jgi:hypothetical protein
VWLKLYNFLDIQKRIVVVLSGMARVEKMGLGKMGLIEFIPF